MYDAEKFWDRRVKLAALAEKPIFKEKGENPLTMTVKQLEAKERGVKDELERLTGRRCGRDCNNMLLEMPKFIGH